jgi:Asp-tRNA(Asn)/Glu-tRNA(Gln) amidotransferase B subunit
MLEKEAARLAEWIEEGQRDVQSNIEKRNDWLRQAEECRVAADRLDLSRASGSKSTDTVYYEKLVDMVLADNPEDVEAHNMGAPYAVGSLVGKAMKMSMGVADASMVQIELRRRLPAWGTKR